MIASYIPEVKYRTGRDVHLPVASNPLDSSTHGQISDLSDGVSLICIHLSTDLACCSVCPRISNIKERTGYQNLLLVSSSGLSRCWPTCRTSLTRRPGHVSFMFRYLFFFLFTPSYVTMQPLACVLCNSTALYAALATAGGSSSYVPHKDPGNKAHSECVTLK